MLTEAFQSKKIESKSIPTLELVHGLRTPKEEIAFTAWPKIQSQSQSLRYGRSIFCLPHRPNFSDSFHLCLHWVSVVRELVQYLIFIIYVTLMGMSNEITVAGSEREFD